MNRLAVARSIMALLLVCGLFQKAHGQQTLRVGLWKVSITMQFDEGGSTETWWLCAGAIDHVSDFIDVAYKLSHCGKTRSDFTTSFVSDSHCNVSGSEIAQQIKFKRSPSRLLFHVSESFAPPLFFTKTSTVIDARFASTCHGGWKPGDMLGNDGKMVHLDGSP